MIPVQHDTRFVMPKEVATRMLSNPLGKLRNATRKRAMFARSKRVVSLAPIVQDGPHVLLYNPAQIPPDQKLAKRYAALPLIKLRRLPGRCIRLRPKLQAAFLKLRPEQTREKQQINLAVERLELMSDTASEEITRRKTKNCFKTV